METLYQFRYVDLNARRRLQVWTILIALIYEVLNSMVLGRPEQRVTWECLGLVCLTTVSFSAVYCFRVKTLKVSSPSAPLGGAFGSRRFLLTGVAAIIFLLILSPATQTPTVQAAVIYVQLKQALLSPDPVGPKTVNKVVTILHTATSNQLSINPVLVNVAAKRFIEGARQNPGAWRGVLALLDYRSSLNKEISSFPTAKCLPLGGAVLSNVKVSNSRFSNCNQVLDNIDWESNLFENVTVIYHGGLTVLENVQFKNCEFSLDNNPRGQLLAQSLWASNRVSIKLLDN